MPMCTNIILCRCPLSPLVLLDLMISLMPTYSKGGTLKPFAVSRLCQVGVFSAQRFITRLTKVKLYQISDSQFKPSRSCSSTMRYSD